ncbi:MAG: [Fe-Fe] hydrogenase large subunit C-terminal domain-containing protein [Bacteroidales bacterium]|nr:[Fe-Fe] hydrogenase large subunit C-terminal domain-containing protein [Bacteroidales bacterium]
MEIYHALLIDEKKCIGCSHCMKVCPTEALRIVNGSAVMRNDSCIDCGRCYSECPTKAIYIKEDDFERIHDYEHPVALIPAVFLAQFPDEVRVSRIYAALKDLGFAHVIEVESAAATYTQAKERYTAAHANTRPMISAFCPAIVRLIQVKYPSLVDNIMSLRAPCDICAIYIRKELTERGIPDKQIGLFYVTPCAAKIAAVKSPVADEDILVDGTINMDSLFNRVYHKIKEQGKDYVFPQLVAPRLSADSILSTLNNGERRLNMAKRSYAVDGLESVMEILDKVENDELEGVDFLELRSCTLSCAGAALSIDNRFLSSERMYTRARKTATRERNGEMARDHEMDKYSEYLLNNVELEPVKARNAMALDPDIGKALEKMERRNKLASMLPQIDCGLCGAPTCETLATDVVRGLACMEHCIFVQRHKEEKGTLSHDAAQKRMREVWGDNRVTE